MECQRILADRQLIFVYGSIVLELVMTTTQIVRDSHVKGPTEKVGDRYGSFALIILYVLPRSTYAYVRADQSGAMVF